MLETPPAVNQKLTAGGVVRDAGPMMEPKEVERYMRHAKALGRIDEDPEGVQQLLEILAAMEEGVAQAVRNSKQRYSWAELARPSGISRQAFAKKYGPKMEQPA